MFTIVRVYEVYTYVFKYSDRFLLCTKVIEFFFDGCGTFSHHARILTRLSKTLLKVKDDIENVFHIDFFTVVFSFHHSTKGLGIKVKMKGI